MFTVPIDGRLSCRLPVMLHSMFHLRELEIGSSVRIASPTRMWDVLSTLINLRKLRLLLSDAEEWLREPESEFELVSSLFASDDVDEASFSPSPISSGGTTLRPISNTFPHLESLSLIGRRYFLGLEHIELLPKSLKVLEFYGNKLIDHKIVLELHHLPDLHTLSICVPDRADFSNLVLAPSITSLCFLQAANLTIPSSFWSLATNLIEFEANIDSSSFQSLPSSLQTFRLPERTIDRHALTFERLPKSITSIELPLLSKAILDSQIGSLPNSITSLHMSVDFDSVIALRAQGYQEPIYYTSSLYHFPSMLQDVYIGDLNNIGARAIESLKLCPLLKKIVIDTTFQAAFTLQSLIGLPKRLTHLDLSWNFGTSTSQLNADSVLSQLPPDLTHLVLPWKIFIISSNCLHLLPKSLETLDFSLCLATDDAVLPSHIAQLPRSLRSLTITHGSEMPITYNSRPAQPPRVTFSDLAIRQAKDSCWTPEMLFNLPRQCLRKLTISKSATKWTKESWASLSPELRYLRLDVDEAFDDESLLGLHPNLTSLHLSGEARFRGDCFQFLPKNLLVLVIALHSLNDDDLKHLPPRLWQLQLTSHPVEDGLTEQGMSSIFHHVSFVGASKPQNMYAKLSRRYSSEPLHESVL